MANRVGWRFPPTHGGLAGGFNDPGIAHFSGAPLSSLARETIQNSLDARKDANEPVHVSFELVDMLAREVGSEELDMAIAACQQEPGATDGATEEALGIARQTLKGQKIKCLRISDRNTTGLRGEHWRALVKKQGVSHKPGVEGAGGSFGIGKYAPFAVSALRTVFYWTCYAKEDRFAEKLQGKSVLMSHQSDEGETQGTGFFGATDTCSELRDQDVPESFRVLGSDRGAVEGTGLTILGFREGNDWRRKIAVSVLRNFFYAIAKGRLNVIIEPDTEDELFEMDQSSVSDWFDYLEDSVGWEDGETTAEETRTLWELASGQEPTAEKQDVDLGHCQLWIRVAEGSSNKVGFVRRTGMLVTTEQRGLLRFPGLRDFVALCVFEDPEGNELLRRMENPNHSQFEPDRLPESDKARGQRALRRVSTWIRSELKKHAGRPEGGTATVLSELAAYLPDLHADDAFEDDPSKPNDSNGEAGFGERVTVRLKPIKSSSPSKIPAPVDDLEGDEGEGEDIGELGGGGTESSEGEGGDGGAGDGSGVGGTGARGGGGRRSAIPVSRVRILPVPERPSCFELRFVAEVTGTIRVVLEEAGDSTTLPRRDIRPTDPRISLEKVEVREGEQVVLEVTAEQPMSDRAWRVSAMDTGLHGSP